MGMRTSTCVQMWPPVSFPRRGGEAVEMVPDAPKKLKIPLPIRKQTQNGKQLNSNELQKVFCFISWCSRRFLVQLVSIHLSFLGVAGLGCRGTAKLLKVPTGGAGRGCGTANRIRSTCIVSLYVGFRGVKSRSSAAPSVSYPPTNSGHAHMCD